MDAEDYSKLPLSQWEDDNVLRELNKCLIAFQQTPMKSKESAKLERRLSPIGMFLGSAWRSAALDNMSQIRTDNWSNRDNCRPRLAKIELDYQNWICPILRLRWYLSMMCLASK